MTSKTTHVANSTSAPHPYTENKTCALYLGIHIAERVLSHIFKDVERMPMHNPGYDFICNRGKKIDVKSACLRKDSSWSFGIRCNTTPDFFLCLAFNNREDLTPLCAWLLPGNKVSHLTAASISMSTAHKWDVHKLDITKVSECCDSLRTAGVRETRPPTTPPHYNPAQLRLQMVDAIRGGLSPTSIGKQYGIPDSTIQYHLSALKEQGLIRKVGYGTWECVDQPKKALPAPRGLSHVGAPQHGVLYPAPRGSRTKVLSKSGMHKPTIVKQASLDRFKQDAVRAHAFVCTFKVPTGLRNWNNKKRIEYLTGNKIVHVKLNIGGGGQRILVDGKKVWLTDRSIVIYDTASYFAEDARHAKSTAIATHIKIIHKIERLLHVSFEIGSDYQFKVSRQHYALIHNALAKQYNESGDKLEIRTGKGAWFIIDNSYNMNEAETVHPSSAMSDNKKVQDWFNGLKQSPITPDFLLSMMHGIQSNQVVFAENMVSHVDAIKQLGSGVKDMTSAILKLQELSK